MLVAETMDAVLHAPTELDETTGKNKTVVSVGDPLPIEITWHNKPMGLDGLIDFYVHTVGVIIEGQRINVVENNCYSTAFNTKLVSESHFNRMVSKFQYNAFSTMTGAGSSEFKTDIDVEIRLCISLDVEPDVNIACPTFTQRTEDCPKTHGNMLGYTWKGVP